jgi:hypothetical protein
MQQRTGFIFMLASSRVLLSFSGRSIDTMRCTFVLPVFGTYKTAARLWFGLSLIRVPMLLPLLLPPPPLLQSQPHAHHVALDTNAADVAQKTNLGKQEQRYTAMLQVLT